jgi:hypothetical protein
MSDNLEEQDTGDLGSNQNDNEEEETKASSDQPLRNSQTSSNKKKNNKKGGKGKKKVDIRFIVLDNIYLNINLLIEIMSDNQD